MNAVRWGPSRRRQFRRDAGVVYVRQPRFGDNTNTTWPEVAHPAQIDPGADLMLLHPDGSEEVLVSGGVGAVTDPFVSFDAQWVYYSLFYDVRPQGYNNQRGLPYLGADIFRINLATRQIQQLTFQEFTPNTGAGHFNESNPVNPGAGFDYLGYGILNLGPAPVAGGKIAFTSNRNGFVPPRGLTNPTLQLFVMDEDGANVTQIAPMNIGSALHPTPLRDGRIMFSSYRDAGPARPAPVGHLVHLARRPRLEARRQRLPRRQAFHFMTQLSATTSSSSTTTTSTTTASARSIACRRSRQPGRRRSTAPSRQTTRRSSKPSAEVSSIRSRCRSRPRGLYSITPFNNGDDEASPFGPDGVTRVGKFTQPSGAPNNDLLVAWSPGPVNALNRPTDVPAVDAGIYRMPGGNIINSPSQLVLIKNDPDYNEVWPRAVVSYAAIHGVAQPAELPWLPNDGTVHAALPAGGHTIWAGRHQQPLQARELPRLPRHQQLRRARRLQHLAERREQQLDLAGGGRRQVHERGYLGDPHPGAGGQHAPQLRAARRAERRVAVLQSRQRTLRILGEIPVRKFNTDGTPMLDPEGNPDTSFLAKIPADTPFTFQTLDRNGLVLNMAQTWHQVRPGEMRTDCGGCHAHSQQPLAFELTAASKPDYAVWDLAKTTPLVSQDITGTPTLRTVLTNVVNIEFYRDIRPILQSSCVSCHAGSNPNPPGKLVLDDLTPYALDDNSGQEVPGDYARLCNDSGARWGYPPLVKVGGQPVWRQTNASRYVRPFQSRRSLLIWKVFGARLDGWTQQRPSDREHAGRRLHAAGGRLSDRHCRPGLHRQHHAAAGQRRAGAEHRSENDVRALGGSRLPDQYRAGHGGRELRVVRGR